MSHLITHATPRAQSAYGSFTPKADQRRYRSAFAAVEGGSDRRFPPLGDIINEGLPVGTKGTHSIRFDQFNGPDGKPHDVKLPGGLVVRECIVPIEDAFEKERLEGQESEAVVQSYDRQQLSKDRPTAGGQVHFGSQILEDKLQTEHRQYNPEEIAALQKKEQDRARMAKARAARKNKNQQPT